MTDTPKVAAAQIKVERTRAALLETAGELLERFQPHHLASDLWEQAKSKGADLAEDAVDAVKSRPVAVGGVVAALTMFLAREPIKDAVSNIYDAMTSSKEPKAKAAALKPRISNKADKPAPTRRRRPTATTRGKTAAKKTTEKTT